MDAKYNDVVQWRYKDVPAVMGLNDSEYQGHQVRTAGELEKLLTSEDFAASRKMQFVEVYMAKTDAPRALVMVAEAAAKSNARMD